MFNILKVKYLTLKPILFLLLCLYVLFLLLIAVGIGERPNTIFLLIQLIFIPFSAYLSLHLFNDLFNSNLTTFLHTFYKRKIEKIYCVCLALYFLPLCLLCGLLELRFGNFDTFSAIILLFSQMVFFSSLALIGFAVFGALNVTITLFVLYLSIELATFGSLRYMVHIFYMDLYHSISFSSIDHLLIVNSLLGIFAYRLFKTIVS